MQERLHTHIIVELMNQFALSTGLEPAREVPRRYLWTDAFAVCNFLEIYDRSGDEHYRSLALRLVEQVHDVLGRHRSDDSRTGRISGLNEQKGRTHPTQGGLRIGKKLKERKPAEPFEEDLEWDRDGQYFHYLTRWMHALHCVSCVTGDPRFNDWAVELAKTAHARFTYIQPSSNKKSMFWKMSIDLSYPLVPSMGHHDPLDGWIVYYELEAGHAGNAGCSQSADLTEEIEDMALICKGKKWATGDALGLGALLCNAFWVAQLIIHAHLDKQDLLETLLDDSLSGLKYYVQNNPLDLPPDYRLAFRELGLAIGLRAIERLEDLVGKHLDRFHKGHPFQSQIHSLTQYRPLGQVIEDFWLGPKIRETEGWKEHGDINTVMLATSLAPDRYLAIP